MCNKIEFQPENHTFMPQQILEDEENFNGPLIAVLDYWKFGGYRVVSAHLVPEHLPPSHSTTFVSKEKFECHFADPVDMHQ